MASDTSRQSSPAIPGAPVATKFEHSMNESESSSTSDGVSAAVGSAIRVCPPAEAPLVSQSVFQPSQTSERPGFTDAAIASVTGWPVAGWIPAGSSESVDGSSRQSYPPRIVSPLVFTAPVVIVTCAHSR